MQKLVCMLAGLAAAVASAAGTSSVPTPVFLNADESYLWRTAPSPTFTLQWAAEPDVTATVEVKGIGYSRTYSDVAGTSLELTLPEATSDMAENVYRLRLTLSDGTEKTAQLAVVRGVGAGGEAPAAALRDAADAKRWSRFKGRAVLPIPLGAQSLTLDGEPVETGLDGAVGWYGFQTDETNVDYAFALDGETAVLRSVPFGLFLTIR